MEKSFINCNSVHNMNLAYDARIILHTNCISNNLKYICINTLTAISGQLEN